MNKRLVLNTIGKILILEAGFMVLPLIVAFYYGESMLNKMSFLSVIGLLLIVGLVSMKIRPKESNYGIKDGFGIVALSWLIMSFFGSLPFIISGQIPSFVDAMFEMVSGFTTTGASILVNVEELSQSMLFWRSFTHFIGGMGILVFALAILPKASNGTVHVMKAEVPGPSFGKLVSKVDITAKILYKIYVVMTIVTILALIIAGMKPFDAMIHGFGAAGTGGFSNKAASVGYFDSAAVDYILGIAMVLFGINFSLYYLVLIGRLRDVFRSEELKFYFGVILFAIAVICFDVRSMYESFGRMVRDVFFTVSTIITTTGYATADFDKWPLLSRYTILLIMFMGSCAGSTAGGLKVSRVLILIKSGINQLKLALNPRRVMTVTEDGRSMPVSTVKSAHIYLILYLGIFALTLFVISYKMEDFLTAFSAVVATLNNIGPGLSAVGPTGNYAFFNSYSKIVLIFTMLLGRLEIIPVLTLFMPQTWRKR